MTNITITDTGKYSVSDASPPTGEKKAIGDNGSAGTALTLKGVSISANFSTLYNDTPVPQKKKDNTDTQRFEFGEADQTGIALPSWSIRGILNTKTSDDMKTWGRLIYFTKTKGVKQLAPPLDSTRTDIISYSKYGEREADNEATKTIDSIYVRIKSLSVEQTKETNLFRYTLELVETA